MNISGRCLRRHFLFLVNTLYPGYLYYYHRYFLSVPHCKERWRNLRACLTRHLKHSKQQAADGLTNHKPYYLADHMKFVLPYTKCRSQRDTSSAAEENYVTNYNIQKSEELDDYEDEKTRPETPVQSFVVAKKEIINQSPKYVFLPPTNSTPIGVKRSPASLLEQDPDFEAGNSSKRNCIPPDTKDAEDADLNFFKSLLPDIRHMTPSQKRKFKMGIFELISSIVE